MGPFLPVLCPHATSRTNELQLGSVSLPKFGPSELSHSSVPCSSAMR